MEKKRLAEMQTKVCFLNTFISASCCTFILDKYFCVFPSGIGSAFLKSKQLQSMYSIKEAIWYHQYLALQVPLQSR